MITAIRFIFSFIVVLAAGRLLFEVPFLRLKDEHPGIKIPLYFLSGAIIISLYMFVLFLLKVKYSIISISAPFLIYSVYYLLMNFKFVPDQTDAFVSHHKKLISETGKSENVFFISALIMLTLLLVTVFLENLATPIYIGDVYCMWFFKPKAIFMARTIPMDLFTNINYWYTSYFYPLLTSLNIAWVTICSGQWSDAAPKTFYSLSYLAAIVFFYYSLKKAVGSKIAMIGTFITFSMPHIVGDITTGYVDLIVAFFGGIGSILMFEWMNDKSKSRYFYLASLFIGAAAWAHNEGLIILGAMTVTLLVYFAAQFLEKRANVLEIIGKMAAFFLLYLAVNLPFKLFTASLHMKDPMASAWIVSSGQLLNIVPNLWRMPIIAGYLLYELFLDTYLWLYFWIFLIILLFLNRNNVMKSNLKYLLLFVILSFAMIFEVFLVSNVNATHGWLVGIINLNLDRAILVIPLSAGFLMFSSFFRREN
jgi:hypothetical protein